MLSLFHRMWRMRVVPLCTVALVVTPTIAAAQSASEFTACSTGALSNCAVISLASQLGVGPGGTNLFQIAIANLGSQATPSLATTIYNLVFLTGQSPAPSGSEIDASLAPVAQGGATITDATPWDVFDSGDAIFLSALSNNGVGGCVASGATAGFSQAGQTCGDGQFLTFSFFTPRAYDPSAFTLADLEFLGLSPDLPADSCNDSTPCTVTRIDTPPPVTATPEPATIALVAAGLAFTGFFGAARRPGHLTTRVDAS